MLNQAFTADNFRNIYDIENRKSSITEYLGTEYKDILAQIKSLQDEISQIKRKANRHLHFIPNQIIAQRPSSKNLGGMTC
jgi:hypothetical protein